MLCLLNLNHKSQLPLILTLTVLTIILPMCSCGPNLDYCNLIPFNKLATCNVTCETCRSADQCSTCPSYLTLSSGKCMVPFGEQMYVAQYFNTTNLKKDRNLLNFSTSRGNLSGTDIIRFCIADQYKFDNLGLFSNGEYVIFNQTYKEEVSLIALNFRLFYSTDLAIIRIEINNKIVYNLTLSAGFALNYTLVNQTDASNVTWQLGVITADPSTYTDQLFAPIRTGMLPLSSTSANITISVENGIIDANSSYGRFWGISDLKVIAKKCQTCVSASIQQFASVLGIIIGISLGVVFVLLIILCIFSKIKQVNYKKSLKKRFQETAKHSTIHSEKQSPNTQNQLD